MSTNTEALADEWQKKASAEASRRNSACDHYGMGNTPENVDPLGAKMAAELRRLAAVEAELERERMRLTACGVVALADTPATAAVARTMHRDYLSAACADVARRVDECISLRAERDALQADYSRLMEKHNNLHLSALKFKAERDALRADAERYRWLVARPCDGEDEFYISAQDSKQASADGWWALGGDMAKEQADAYIDAAMKGTQ